MLGRQRFKPPGGGKGLGILDHLRNEITPTRAGPIGHEDLVYLLLFGPESSGTA
jgi:hypothetical protein